MRKCVLVPVLAALLLGTVLAGAVATLAQTRPFVGLSAQERKWLDENRDQIVQNYDASFPPVEFRDKNGVYAGVAADITARIEKLLGVRFRKEPVYDWNAVPQGLKKGDIALCAAIVRTPEREEEAYFTGPYISLPLVIITTTRAFPGTIDWADLSGKRVGVVSGYITEQYVRAKAQGRFTVVPMTNVQEGLRSVSFGEVAAFVENLASASYYIEQQGLSNLRVAGTTEYSVPLSIGVSRKYPLLYSAVQKALSEISSEEIEASRKRWISLSSTGVLSPEVWRFLKLVAAFSALLLVSLGLITFFLKRRLNEKVESLRLAQQELLEQSERLSLATEATSAGVWDFYPDTGEAYFSDQWYAILGLEPGAVAATFAGWIGLVHPDDREATSQRFLSYIDSGGQGLFEAEFRMRQADGGYRWVLGKGRAIAWDESGRPTRLVGLNLDIQKLKGVQEELRQSEALAKAAFDQTFQFCGLLTTDGAVVNVNRRALAFGGATLEQVAGKPFWEGPWWPDKQAAKDLLEQDIATVLAGGPVQREVQNVDARGRPAVMDYSLSPLTGPDGAVEFLIAEGRNVTETREAEAALKQSEEKYRAIFNSAPVGIFRSTTDGRLLDGNPSLARMLGYDSRESLLAGITNLAVNVYRHSEDRRQFLDALLASPEGVSLESEFKRRDGTPFFAILNASLQPGEAGGSGVINGTIEDITERRRAEVALRESEERYRSVIQNMLDVYFRSDAAGRLTMVSPSGLQLFGYGSMDEVLGQLTESFYMIPRQRTALLAKLAAEGVVRDHELLLKRKDGSPLQAAATVSYYRDEKGRILGVEGIFRDITERKALELRLADQLAFQEALLDTIPYPVFYKGADTRFIGFNKAYEEVFGVRRAELIGKRVLEMEYLPPADRQAYQAEDEAVIASVGHVSKEMPIPFADGETHQTLYAVTGFRLADGTSGGLIGIIVDITERKRAEEALRQSEERFSRIFELAPECITFVRLSDALTIDANAAFETITGYPREEAMGRPVTELALWDDLKTRGEFIARLLDEGHVKDFEFLLRRKDGELRRVVSSAQLVNIAGEQCYVSVIHDITDERRMQELLIQSEKMMSVGSLAAGIAHEINNPLGIVHQAVQNLILRTSPDQKKNLETAAALGLRMDQLQAYLKARKLDVFLEDIQGAALRASGIIRNMLNFSRRSESKRQACDLHRIIEQSVFLASSDYDLKKSYDFKRIEINLDLDELLPPCRCTETEIEQVLLNLLRNAAQAMSMASPPTPSPRIDIRLRAGEGCVRLEVADNGPGMAPDIQRKVFEPFFTTKPPGVGTGLGLSVSYFIITKGHGGRMWMSSTPGRGTTFFIELPAEGQETRHA